MIFLSYARKDGRDAAFRLKGELEREGYKVWLDTQQIEGGASWTREIENAINECEVLVGLLTIGSFESEVCRAEQIRALRIGKCVIPVLVQREADTPLYLETKNWREYPAQTAQLLTDIKARHGAILKPEFRQTRVKYVTAPIQVAHEVRRPESLRSLREAVIAEDGNRTVALTALEGMGGIGKTVLAQALCRDEVVQAAFPDGIVWATVGREHRHPYLHQMKEIAKALGDDPTAYENDLAAENCYRTVVANKAALVVLDDIWNTADLTPFLAESARSRFLFTTRDAGIARFAGAREHRADLLDDSQARELLAAWTGHTPQSLPGCASEIIQECGRLPLALSTMGALLKDTAPEEWHDWLDRLRRAEIYAIESMLPQGQTSFFRAIDISVRALKPGLRERYEALAVLLEDMAAGEPILQTLWNVDASEARRLGRLLADRSLAVWDSKSFSLQLHDLQLDYVRAQYSDQEALSLINGAVRLSAHVIEKDPSQFASQVTGRLLAHTGFSAIQDFLVKLANGCPSTWLRPMHPALHPPGTALFRTLAGHSSYVYGVAVTPDGQLAVSASEDKTLKGWDLASGRELCTLAGHSAAVRGVAVTPDGRWAVSASEDSTLKVWDLASGHELRMLVGHSAAVKRVAVTPDGRWAVSASDDKTLKVWDLASGRELRTLAGHSAAVRGVAVTPDGHWAVSASEDSTLKVWDLASGHELRMLVGHSAAVKRVAVTPDGHWAVSTSEDKTLKVWDLASGRELRTLAGHSDFVLGVAVTPDGQRAVSASSDETLKVWDLASGRELGTLVGHGNSVKDVAITPDGQRAVSASDDKTLKIWELATGRELPTPAGHSAYITGVAVTPDGQRAVSASWDKTLKVWDLATGRELRTLAGHPARVFDVAVTPDGQRAVSASDDKTLKVWDLASGLEVRTLAGHSGSTIGVAVTPDGHWAVSGSEDSTLKVWDLASGLEVRTLAGHSSIVNGVAVTPDGQRAVSASDDKTLKVWDLASGLEARTLAGHSGWVMGVAVTPDGQRAVSASADKTLKVWDLDSGRELRTLVGHADAVIGVGLTPDGQRAVSASEDKTLKLWDLTSGQALVTFHCDARVVRCVFADGRTIIAGDTLGRIHFLAVEEPTHPKSLTAKR